MLNNFTSLLFICSLYCGIISCNSPNQTINSETQSKLDSINAWIANTKDNSFTNEERKTFINKAFRLNKSLKNDSLQRDNLLKIPDAAYYVNDPVFFKKFNDQVFNIFNKKQDTLGLAISYYNFALAYLDLEKVDSSYYYFNEAKKMNEILGREIHIANNFYGMAYLQYDIQNYTGSEISTFQAIKYYKKLKNNLWVHECYNLLGMIFNKLSEYDRSFHYFSMAEELIPLLEDKDLKTNTNNNNFGFLFQEKGDYLKSKQYFNKVLQDKNLIKTDSVSYARTLINITYSRFLLGDTVNVYRDFQRALQIRESFDYGSSSGIIEGKIYLSEYFAYKTDTITAIQYAKEARNLALNISENNYYLRSLKLLAKLDQKNSNQYFNNYTTLNDSLQIQERQLRNKFTRIRFETNEHIEEKEKQVYQKFIISVAATVFLVVLGLLYYIKTQRSKNKELLFEKEQQKANEEIYSLMLKQQASLDEGRMNERNRIAEELHDGVIGGLAGTRLNFEMLDLEGDKEDLEAYNELIVELQKLEKEVRNISHELKSEWLTSDQNFDSIIKLLINKQQVVSNSEHELYVDKSINWNQVDGLIKINTYRIIQEALLNCQKYAQATIVKISFIRRDKTLILEVEDNGCGFELKKNKEGIGLENIKSRAKKMQGSYFIESKLNTGTLIRVNIPNYVQ